MCSSDLPTRAEQHAERPEEHSGQPKHPEWSSRADECTADSLVRAEEFLGHTAQPFHPRHADSLPVHVGQVNAPRAAARRYLSDRKRRNEMQNQIATAASQTAAARSVLPLEDAL